MLKFICIIRPHKAEALCEHLLASRLVEEMTAEEVLGRGRRDSEGGGLEYLPKVIVSGYISATDKDAVVEIVLSTCRSGRIGDGKLFFVFGDAPQAPAN